MSQSDKSMPKRLSNPQRTTNDIQLPNCKIDIRPLKAFVTENLPKDSILRSVILAERDALDARELLGKIETWLNLLRFV